VRVCQIGNCAEEEYVLTSGTFSITPAAAIAPARRAPAVLCPDRSGNLDVTFGLGAAARVALKAYAPDGSLAAVLVEGRHPPGNHAYRIDRDRFRPGEVLFLRLEADGRTLAALPAAR
jgi:hypothetical protein